MKMKITLKEKIKGKKRIENETFYDEILKIRNNIIKNINECNAQKDKDIIILIDFNNYRKKRQNFRKSFNR